MNFKQSRTLFVVNPASANGRTNKKWITIEADLRKQGFEFDVCKTRQPREATDITRNALVEGYNRIIAVGGDGTINEVVNGFYTADGSKKITQDACFSAIPMGTGGDFSRMLDLRGTSQAIYEICQGNREIACDVVDASFTGWNGAKESRHFINIADVGVGSETVYKVNNRSKAFGGFLSFLIGALTAIVQFKNKDIRVYIDDLLVYDGKSSLVVVGNGQYFGGGMKITPTAKVNDGLLDVVILQDFSKIQLLFNLPSVYKGLHTGHDKIQCFTGKKVKIVSSQEIYLEMDGETPGTGDCEFMIKHADLKVIY